MARATQQRTLQTRAKLLSAAQAVVSEHGFEALRVEQVVQNAGVAKGTFFAHFRDKDALMEILVGAEFHALLDALQTAPAPKSVDQLLETMAQVHAFIRSERYVFDLMLRYSGAAAITEIGPIAECFERYVTVVTGWFPMPETRSDVAPELLAEGVQAFAFQAMSLTFCALHETQSFEDRLCVYLKAWLTPAG